MDPSAPAPAPSSSGQPTADLKRNGKTLLLLAYQSFGVVYGDLSTSPLFVFRSVFSGKINGHQDEETIFGMFSLIFWTFTLIPLLKYVIIVLSADDNGEGGTFALYSLLCRHAKFSLLPNQQAADEELSTYYNPGVSASNAFPSPFRRLLERHERLRVFLLLIVLFGACMVIGDGILTPAISVLSAISGLQVPAAGLTDWEVIVISCIVLVFLFILQHRGTHRVAFLFAPIVILWLFCIAVIGLYNTIYWNPRIYKALSPYYIVKFFQGTGKDGWVALGGILLSVTGTEALFADLGHFTAVSIRLAFVCVIYPCLVLQYMGQSAFLSKNIYSAPTGFYDSIPDPVFWPVFIIATLAAVVGSQAVISATYSIIMQCHALGCFPRVKIVHTSRWIFGQIYIPDINWILMLLCLAVTVGFRDTTLIGNAYGIACISVMFITTWLMALIIIVVWKQSAYISLLFLLFFGSIEGVYLSSALMKVPQGGWVPLAFSLLFVLIMYVWHYGTLMKYLSDLQNKVSMKWILTLGPSLGIVRVPGIGLIYTDLVTGVPAVFSHFITNLPAFHQVLVLVCIKSVQVPYVPEGERFLIGRIGPRAYRMYRCIVRNGYKDVPSGDDNFEMQLILNIAQFIQMEVDEASTVDTNSSPEGRMLIIQNAGASVTGLVVREVTDERGTAMQSLQTTYDEESSALSRQRNVRYEISESINIAEDEAREELLALLEAKQAGVAYIIGHSNIKARKSSGYLKKFAIDYIYSFLRKNCRGPEVVLHIPHVSLIEVGMISYV